VRKILFGSSFGHTPFAQPDSYDRKGRRPIKIVRLLQSHGFGVARILTIQQVLKLLALERFDEGATC
jgi:hypothetical protein